MFSRTVHLTTFFEFVEANISHAKIYDDNRKRVARVNIRDTSSRHARRIVATFASVITPIMPAARVNTKAGGSQIALRVTCCATVISLASTLIGVTNSINYY